MIQYTQGNLLEADVESLVDTVNTVGLMGKKGIASKLLKQWVQQGLLIADDTQGKRNTVYRLSSENEAPKK